MASAVVLPTCRMPSPNSTRAKVRPFDASMAATSFFATVCPRRTGSPSAFTRPMSKLASSSSDSE